MNSPLYGLRDPLATCVAFIGTGALGFPEGYLERDHVPPNPSLERTGDAATGASEIES